MIKVILNLLWTVCENLNWDDQHGSLSFDQDPLDFDEIRNEGSYQIGTTVSYNCDNGYLLTGGRRTRNCTISGWSP